MQQKGFAFPPDGEWQHDFESHFEFDETEDQLRCINEIKDDMERDVPMDRLLCGDVGFGKTEVALRAAFKCVTAGKQCAILVPTTILAWQHYQTILRRMEGFPVDVELLSRFRTTRQQDEILRKVKRGSIDIIVGTHRLVSKDVRFHDLGLVIIDEEQRFGVAQKEKLKQLCSTADVLTLSATPIPRTLNMALSAFGTCPSLRRPPTTGTRCRLMCWSTTWGFWRTPSAGSCEGAARCTTCTTMWPPSRARPPASSSGCRRPASALATEDDRRGAKCGVSCWTTRSTCWCAPPLSRPAWMCPPPTPCLENADRMGLSQLHQLRGRVGRSSRRAYAYLTHPNKVLTEIAQKRLSAIREFTEFGLASKSPCGTWRSGGRDVLGERAARRPWRPWAGDMYVKLLNEAVTLMKGEEPVRPVDQECLVDLQAGPHPRELHRQPEPAPGRVPPHCRG